MDNYYNSFLTNTTDILTEGLKVSYLWKHQHLNVAQLLFTISFRTPKNNEKKINIFPRTFIGTLMGFLKFYRKYQILTEWLSLHFTSWEMQVSGSQLVQRYFGPTYLSAFIVNYTGLSKWCYKFTSKETWIQRSGCYII